MTLVAGVDSSTQSCKLVVLDAETGALVRQGRAAHPPGTEVDPEAWWQALCAAIDAAGGLDDVAAVSVAGQQHGMVALDEDGRAVRKALLWNDTRSAAAATALTRELPAEQWAQRVGIVPVASFTVSKLRWFAEHEPAEAARTAAVCLPHDWLSWRLRGDRDPRTLTTDRSDASGTGYYDAVADRYCDDLLQLAFGRSDVLLPRVLGAVESTSGPASARLAAGAGDNAAAMLALDAGSDTVISLGTSGVACAVTEYRPADPSGIVAGFADATERHLALVCTLNAARVLEVTARMLGVDLKRLSELALSAPPGADGVVFVPYLDGERTPDLPDATGALHGLTSANTTPATIARAAVEGMLCGIAAGLDALTAQGISTGGVRLTGGAAAASAVRHIAPAIFGVPVAVPPNADYVAIGAARQAAQMLQGSHELPPWTEHLGPLRWYRAPADTQIRERYRAAATLYLPR
ncbi:xylulokinase [Nocardia goodfellowii]